MGFFTREVSIAVDMLQYLYEKEEVCHAQDIAESLVEPYQFCVQILKKLKDFGYVASIRGRSGGYMLSQRAYDKRLSDLLNDFNSGFEGELARPEPRASEYISMQFHSLAFDTLICDLLNEVSPEIQQQTTHASGAV